MRTLIAGCGALGSQIAMHIALPGRQFVLLDDDRIEDDNILTSAFLTQHVGALKVHVLAEMMYRKAGVAAEVQDTTLTEPPKVDRLDLVVDTFDNTASRLLLCDLSVPTLHVGVSEARTGAVLWDADFPRWEPEYVRGRNPVCTHELGRHILRLTAVVAASIIDDYLARGKRRSVIISPAMEVLG